MLLAQKWKLQGGVCVCIIDDNEHYFQAMTRSEEDALYVEGGYVYSAVPQIPDDVETAHVARDVGVVGVKAQAILGVRRQAL